MQSAGARPAVGFTAENWCPGDVSGLMGRMRHALLAASLLLGCQREPSSTFEEFPPPRLAKVTSAGTPEGERVSVAGSRARVSLRSGRHRSAPMWSPVTGWLELDDGAGIPIAGELRVDLGVLRHDDESAVRSVVGLRALDAEPLRLDWDAESDSWSKDTGQRVTLALNRHRSELRLHWSRPRARPDESATLVSRPASVALRAHGLSPRFERADGHLLAADEMQLALDLRLQRP